MAIINTVASGHGNRSEVYADGSSIRYNVFLTGTAKETARLKAIRQAYKVIDRLDKKINLNGPCNRYFSSLPKGKTFSDYWRDPSIFINYSPSLTAGFYGATHSNDKDICISAWCLDTQNRWMLAATLVHEFAHVGGAPGGASHAAEKAVKKCGFTPQYEPTILGSLEKLGKYIENLA